MHLACTDEDTAVAVRLTPGQAGDAPQFDALFAAATARVPDAEEVVADKGYDSWAIKDTVIEAGMPAHIPSKKTAVEPWPIDEDAYRDRNRVERLINKMKQFRAVATRYDKLAESFLGHHQGGPDLYQGPLIRQQNLEIGPGFKNPSEYGLAIPDFWK